MQLEGDRAFAAVDVPAELAYDRTGPGTPAGRYLRQFWIPVAEINDVKPARAKTITIMSEKFTLYRGESGAALQSVAGRVCRIVQRQLRGLTVLAPTVTSTDPARAPPIASCPRLSGSRSLLEV